MFHQKFGLYEGVQRLQNNPLMRAKTALVDGDREETFAQLFDQIQRLSSAFQSDLGLKVGDIISVASPNCLEFVHCLGALDRVGSVCLPIPHMLTAEELTNVLNEFQPKVLFLHDSQLEKFEQIKPNLRHQPRIFSILSDSDHFEKYSDLLAKGESKKFTNVEIAEDDNQLILLTSGTTGNPKGVMKTFRNMNDGTSAMGKMAEMFKSIILYNSLGWLGGNGIIWGCCVYGCTVVFMNGYQKDEYIRLLIKHEVTSAFLLPQPFVDFSEMDEEIVKQLKVKFLTFGGGTVSPAAMERVLKKFPGCVISNGYGMTEAGFISSIYHTAANCTPERKHLLKAVGQLTSSTHCIITDEDGNEVPIGESGEIVIRSSQVTPGYYKNPVATENAFRNGWFRTGDIGNFDKEGNLYIHDRIKDTVKTPEGYNIFPIEIETVLVQREDVATASVIGVPLENGNGEILVACIVKKAGTEENSEETLAAYCKEHIAAYKVPKHFLYFEEFSYNRNNKVDKRKMRARAVETGRIPV